MDECRASDEVLRVLRERGGRWAAYQNADLGHPDVGRLQFLKVGPDCTFDTPPAQAPDSNTLGFGWRYWYVGMVDLGDGTIKKP